MKHIILIAACIILIWLTGITSCKKDKETPVVLNKAPIARAGVDITITLTYCNDKNGIATLDGSGSSDSDYNIASYNWVKIYGPEGVIITNQYSARAQVEKISVGQYAFELTVRDTRGLASKDTLLISASGPTPAYDLDITMKSPYSFSDNYEDCYYSPCSYSDMTRISGKVNIAPIGEFDVYISEYADSASSSDQHDTFISLYKGTGNNESVNGTCSINFKKLIVAGGGAFDGTLTVTGGSADYCGGSFPNNLPPLIIAGSLDLATNMVTITIKGKVNF